MAKEVITRFKLETTQYDSKLRDSAHALARLTQQLSLAGKDFDKFAQKSVGQARAFGDIAVGASNAKDKVRELVAAYNTVAKEYNALTEQQKKGDYGQGLASSLEKLKVRISDAKKELYDFNGTMQKTSAESVDLTGILTGVGQQFGINTGLLSGLTAGTLGMTAAVTAGAAAVAAATKMWADYNAELAKQQQVTTVTTGLEGDDADAMTIGVRSLVRTYDVDFREAINAANKLMTQFGVSSDEALQLLRDGLQGMIQGDGPKLLSMIQQYAPAFRDAGVSASELIAVIQNSEGGIFSDENMNAIVMGIKNIRLMTKATSDALKAVGIDGEEMSQKLSNGSMTIFDALKEVAGAIGTVDASSREAGAVMQQVFGRQGAMAGTKLGEAIETLNLNLEETKAQTGLVGESYKRLEKANYDLELAMNEAFGASDKWEVLSNNIKVELYESIVNVINITKEAALTIDSFYQEVDKLGRSNVFVEVFNEINAWVGPLSTSFYWIQRIYRLLHNDLGAAADIGGNLPLDEKVANTKGDTSGVFDPVVGSTFRKVPKVGRGGGRSVEKTEEQLINENITKLTNEYVNATNERREAIKKEISTLKERQETIKSLKDEAIGNMAPPTGSMAAMNKELQRFQKQQQLAANPAEWNALQRKIDDINTRINVLKGNLPKDSEANFTVNVNAEQLEKLRTMLPTDDSVKINVEPGKVVLPDIPKEIEQVLSTKVGQVVTPEIASEIVQTISTKLGNVVTPEIAEQLTQTINTKVGQVITPDIASELTQVVNVEPGKVDMPDILTNDTYQVTVTADTSEAMQQVSGLVSDIEGMTVSIHAKVKDTTIDTAAMTESMIQKIQLSIQDTQMQTLTNVVRQAVLNGLNVPQEDVAAIMESIFETGTMSQDLFDKLIEQFKQQWQERTGEELEFDKKSGKLQPKDDSKNPKEVSMKDVNQTLANLGSGMNSITSGLTQLGIDIPAGISKAIGAIQAVAGILTGISALITIITATTSAKAVPIVGWLLSRGGIVDGQGNGVIHAATGTVVPGNYGFDAVPAMLTSGEVVLNRAQQGNIASQLQGGAMGNIQLEAVIQGEQLTLVQNNRGLRTGRGEYVQSKMRR